MRVLLLGASGFLGSILRTHLEDVEIVGTSAHARRGLIQVDVTDEVAVKTLLDDHWDLVVHAAGYVDVESCERAKQVAWDVNVGGTRNIMRHSRAKVMFFSTDNVFDRPQPCDESMIPNPPNYYGMCKLACESEVLGGGDGNVVVRLPFLYGLGHKFSSRFAGKITFAPDPTTCNPLYAPDVAGHFKDFYELDGLVHFGGATVLSRLDFYNLASVALGYKTVVHPKKNGDGFARRPSSSVLISRKVDFCGRGVMEGLDALRTEAADS